ncbi:MAG: MFS transporter, partial [Pseudomonadota bacterium]
AQAVEAMGWTLIVMLPLTVALAVFAARETPTPPQKSVGMLNALKALAENYTARRVLLPDLLLGVAQGVSGGLFLFYFQDVLGFVDQSQTLVAIYFVAGFLGVPIWWIAGRHFGKDRALMAALLYSALTSLPLLILPHASFGIAALFMVIAGLAQGGTILLTRALMADVVDEDEIKTSLRRSGLYFGLLQMTSKTGLAAGPLALAALQLFGYNPTLGAQNSAHALGALSALFIGVPILLFVLAAVSLRKYPLDETRQAALAAAISARHAQNSENT